MKKITCAHAMDMHFVAPCVADTTNFGHGYIYIWGRYFTDVYLAANGTGACIYLDFSEFTALTFYWR